MTPRKKRLIWTKGILKKRFNIKNLDNDKYY